jgi:hypothetical protein
MHVCGPDLNPASPSAALKCGQLGATEERRELDRSRTRCPRHPSLRPREHERSHIGGQKRAQPCLAPTDSGVANGEAPFIDALQKICPRHLATMVSPDQNSPDSPAAGRRPSRPENRHAGRHCRHGNGPATDPGAAPSWILQRSRGQLVVRDAPALPRGRSAGVPSVTSQGQARNTGHRAA